MPQSFDRVYQSMVWMWKEVKQADPDNALRFCQGWLNYAKEYFQLKKWPFSMLKVCLQRGPTNFMRPRDVVKMMLFFYGNKLPYICAGHWVLIRIGISNCDRKDHRAKQAKQSDQSDSTELPCSKKKWKNTSLLRSQTETLHTNRSVGICKIISSHIKYPHKH